MSLGLSRNHSATRAKNSKPQSFPVWVLQVCILPVTENQPNLAFCTKLHLFSHLQVVSYMDELTRVGALGMSILVSFFSGSGGGTCDA